MKKGEAGAVDAVGAQNLAMVALRSPSITRTLGIVTRHGVPLTPTAASLLALIERRLVASEKNKVVQ